jgi:hypothetical protein
VLWQVQAAQSTPSEPLFLIGAVIFANESRLLCVRDGSIPWSRSYGECKAAFADKAGTTYISHSAGVMTPVVAAVDRDGKELWKVQSRYAPLGLDPAGRLSLPQRHRRDCLRGHLTRVQRAQRLPPDPVR